MLPVANFIAHLNDTVDSCITLLVSYHVVDEGCIMLGTFEELISLSCSIFVWL